MADGKADRRERLRRLLEPHWAVEVVTDGASAQASVRARPPQLVLADDAMPGLGELVRTMPPSTPVVVLSAQGGEETAPAGLPSGVQDLLVEPFSERELLARVATQLELAHLRRERATQVEETERAVRFSERFVGTLGHELRNPLSAISTAASLLGRRAGDSEKIAAPAGRILASADRLDRMVSQLVDFLSIRDGRGIPLERVRVDLAEVCRRAIEGLHVTRERRVQLEVAGDTWGCWDPDRLSQLVSNLTENACQHSTPGTPVQVRLDDLGAHALRLEVRNHGVTPPDVLSVLFEPLREGARRRARSSGLGLGLCISQQIALGHGGAIRVESDESVGTRFTVELPRG